MNIFTKKNLAVFCCCLPAMFASAQTVSKVQLELAGGYPDMSTKKAIERNVSGLLTALNSAYVEEIDLVLPATGLLSAAEEGVDAMWNSARFYCTQSKIIASLNRIGDGYEIRGIPILIDDVQEADEIVIEIEANGTVSDVYLALAQHQFANISVDNNVVSETQQNIIRHFLEALKTAYMKKNIDFLNDVYSDNALIIVGRKIQRTSHSSLEMSDTGKKSLYSASNATYKKYTKAEYIENLKEVFRNNNKIQLEFSNIDIKQHKKQKFKDFYGVRLLQDWRADRYHDVGLLYFVIQFRENDNPLIWVRVWQDPATDSLQQIGLGDFIIRE